MSEINIAYLEDGEWLSINTNIGRGGMLIGIEPDRDDNITATDPSKGWARGISPSGHFKMYAPYEDRLNDWGLELSGVPRIYDDLKLDAITELFGQEVTSQVQQYHRKFNQRRESVGDLLAKFMRRGPMKLEEGFGLMKSLTVETPQDINFDTRLARANLLEHATEDSGRLIIARSVLIAEA